MCQSRYSPADHGPIFKGGSFKDYFIVRLLQRVLADMHCIIARLAQAFGDKLR
jgi:hypothetical protein